MARRLKSTNRPRAGAALLALLIVAIAAPGTALAAPAATDEYSLGPVGSETSSGHGDVQQAPDRGAPEPPTPGVVGEDAASESPLDAIGSIAAPGTWALVALLALAGGIVLARLPREQAR